MARVNKSDALWGRIVATKPDEAGVRRLHGPDLNAEFGMSTGWATTVMAGWERQGRLTMVREGRKVVGVRVPTPQAAAPTATEPQPAAGATAEKPNGTSTKDRLVQLLQMEADERGRVRLSTDEIRRKMGTDPHDTVKLLHDLKQQGDLSFREQRQGKSYNLYGFRLQGALAPRTAPTDNALAPWSLCPECWWDRRYHRKGTDDRTVLICPEPPKSGSPRWQAAKEPKPVGTPVRSRQHGNGGHRAPERVEPPAPVITYYECHELVGEEQCLQRFNDPVALRMHKEAKHSGEPLPQNVKQVVHTFVGPTAEQQALQLAPDPVADLFQPEAAQAATAPASRDVDWARYPLLTEVARVYHARQQAKRLLEAAGDAVPGQLLHEPIGQAATGQRIAEEITRLLQALGYKEEGDDKS